MTTNQARKLIGKKSDQYSDEQLEKLIARVEFFKNLFFKFFQSPELRKQFIN